MRAEEFKKGECYTRQQIREAVGGGSVHDYLPHENERVLCACLSQEYEPDARVVVLVGAGPGVQREAEMLRGQKEAIPVFFKKVANLWVFAGWYTFEKFSDEPDVVERFSEDSGRMNLTGVVFLRESNRDI